MRIFLFRREYSKFSYIVKSYDVKNSINTYIHDKTLKHFIFVEIPSFIRVMQNVRNESVHGDSTPLKGCDAIRSEVIGIGQRGILSEFNKNNGLIRIFA